MSYNFYHRLSTVTMENNAVLDNLQAYLEGEMILTKTELLDMVINCKKLNDNLLKDRDKIADKLTADNIF